MRELKRLGDAELEIMLAIWAGKTPVTSTFVLEQLEGRRRWALSTVMTSLTRLCGKGYLVCDRSSGSNLYSPLVTEEEYKAAESRSFMERLYGNSFQSLVTNLYNSKLIENADLDELRSFLDKLEKEGDGNA